MKILYFEGAGCAPRGDVENCRIRTAFTNDEGKKIYLELSGIEVTKTMHESFKIYTNAGFVDHCFEIVEAEKDCENKYRLPYEKDWNFEYSKDGILEFVNNELNCSFAEVVICDRFYGYHVHADNRGYNFIEDHKFDDTRADRARAAFEKLDNDIRQKLNSKYSKISLLEIADNEVVARCYASDNEMRAAGLDPQQRIFKGRY